MTMLEKAKLAYEYLRDTLDPDLTPFDIFKFALMKNFDLPWEFGQMCDRVFEYYYDHFMSDKEKEGYSL